jgi:hypothetical protein
MILFEKHAAVILRTMRSVIICCPLTWSSSSPIPRLLLFLTIWSSPRTMPRALFKPLTWSSSWNIPWLFFSHIPWSFSSIMTWPFFSPMSIVYTFFVQSVPGLFFRRIPWSSYRSHVKIIHYSLSCVTWYSFKTMPWLLFSGMHAWARIFKPLWSPEIDSKE